MKNQANVLNDNVLKKSPISYVVRVGYRKETYRCFFGLLMRYSRLERVCSTWNKFLSAKLDEQDSEIGLRNSADFGCLAKGSRSESAEFFSGFGAQ